MAETKENLYWSCLVAHQVWDFHFAEKASPATVPRHPSIHKKAKSKWKLREKPVSHIEFLVLRTKKVTNSTTMNHLSHLKGRIPASVTVPRVPTILMRQHSHCSRSWEYMYHSTK